MAAFLSEYIATGEPLFPVEAGAAGTCYQHFVALADANCTTHESTTLPVRVRNCVVGGNGASGVLVLERASIDASPGPSRVETGTAVYRLRVVGPDGLWLLEPTYCRPGYALATYHLHHAGLFSVEVLLLYSSFSLIQPNASRAVQTPWAGYLTLDVRPISDAQSPAATSLSGDPPAAVRLVQQRWSAAPDESILSSGDMPSGGAPGGGGDGPTRLQQAHHLRWRRPAPDTDAPLPLCPGAGPLPGRWRFAFWPPAADATASTAAALLRTCIWSSSPASVSASAQHPDADDCGAAARWPLRYDSHPAGLSWRPHGCRMRAFAGIPPPPPPLPPSPSPPVPSTIAAASAPLQPVIEPGACLPPGRRVCFLGDSHTRYLLNSVVMWQHAFRTSVNNTAKELLTSDNVYYETMRFGDDWPAAAEGGGGSAVAAAADRLVAANCTDVVANFGQWPASYRSGPAPYGALQYLRQLLRLRRVLLAFVARSAARARVATAAAAALGPEPRGPPGRSHGHGRGGGSVPRVFWVTTVMSSLKARLESAGVDWRTDPLLMLYNRLALDVMSGELPAAMARMIRAGGTGAEERAVAAASETGDVWAGAAGVEAAAAGGGLGAAANDAEQEQEEEQEQEGEGEGKGAGAGVGEEGRRSLQPVLDAGAHGRGKAGGGERGGHIGRKGTGQTAAAWRTAREPKGRGGEGVYGMSGGHSGESGGAAAGRAGSQPHSSRTVVRQRDEREGLHASRSHQEHSRRAQQQQRQQQQRQQHPHRPPHHRRHHQEPGDQTDRLVSTSGAASTVAMPTTAQPLHREHREQHRQQQQEAVTAAAAAPAAAAWTPSSSSPSASQLWLVWLWQALAGRRSGGGSSLRRRLLQQLLEEAEVAAAEREAAAQAVESIPVIDTWSAARILHDATWDGVHYANTGAVGLMQLRALLHALCSDLGEVVKGGGGGGGGGGSGDEMAMGVT